MKLTFGLEKATLDLSFGDAADCADGEDGGERGEARGGGEEHGAPSSSLRSTAALEPDVLASERMDFLARRVRAVYTVSDREAGEGGLDGGVRTVTTTAYLEVGRVMGEEAGFAPAHDLAMPRAGWCWPVVCSQKSQHRQRGGEEEDGARPNSPSSPSSPFSPFTATSPPSSSSSSSFSSSSSSSPWLVATWEGRRRVHMLGGGTRREPVLDGSGDGHVRDGSGGVQDGASGVGSVAVASVDSRVRLSVLDTDVMLALPTVQAVVRLASPLLTREGVGPDKTSPTQTVPRCGCEAPHTQQTGCSSQRSNPPNLIAPPPAAPLRNSPPSLTLPPFRSLTPPPFPSPTALPPILTTSPG